MSLLNDLLNDLAKQEPSKQLIPFLQPAPRRSQNKAILRIFYVSLFLSPCIGFVFFILLGVESTNPEKLNNKEPAVVLETSTLSEKPVEQRTQPISYLAALPPIKSANIELKTAPKIVTGQNGFPDWVETQDEPKAAIINKVYAPLTLAQWHDAQMNKALQAMEDGRDEMAIDILQGILVKIPNSSNASENLASLYLVYGDLALATDVVNEGLEHSPSNIRLITIKARLMLEQGKSDEALKFLSDYHPAMATYPDFYSVMATALQAEGRIADAGSLFKSLIQIDTNNGQYWLGYAISLEHNHELNQAKDAYVRASQSPDTESEVRAYAENRLKTLQG